MDDCDRTGEGGEEISSSSSDNGDIGRQGLLKTSSSFGKTGLPEKKKQQQKKPNNNIRKIQVKPLNSQKLFKCNFSLQFPSIIQQTGNENTQIYQVEVVILI